MIAQSVQPELKVAKNPHDPQEQQKLQFCLKFKGKTLADEDI